MPGVHSVQPSVYRLLVRPAPTLVPHRDVVGVATGEKPAETGSRIKVEASVLTVSPQFHDVELKGQVSGMIMRPHLRIHKATVLL